MAWSIAVAITLRGNGRKKKEKQSCNAFCSSMSEFAGLIVLKRKFVSVVCHFSGSPSMLCLQGLNSEQVRPTPETKQANHALKDVMCSVFLLSPQIFRTLSRSASEEQ
jgi:hypothetical protein